MNRDRNDELRDLGLTESERANMERMLAEFRQETERRAERPEMFWAAQRTRIAANIRKPHTQRGLGWAATLAAVSAMVVFMTVPSHRTKQNLNHAATVNHAAAADDEALLRSVDETTSSDVPDALAPANTLATEMNRGIEGATNRKSGRNNE